jgi:hypothetical protein
LIRGRYGVDQRPAHSTSDIVESQLAVHLCFNPASLGAQFAPAAALDAHSLNTDADVLIQIDAQVKSPLQDVLPVHRAGERFVIFFRTDAGVISAIGFT